MKTITSMATGLAILLTCGLVAAQTQAAPSATGASAPAGNQPEPMVLLVPVEVQNPATQSGCWAQLYDENDFKGEMLTLVGPIQLQSLDRATGRHLRHAIDSVVLGPKATLTVYEHRMFKDRSVSLTANAREPSVRKKLGTTGRIESLQLTCAQ